MFTVWQHIVVLLTIKKYEGKSYRMFAEWVVEAHYVRIFLQLSKMPHFTTLQKFADRINNVRKAHLGIRECNHHHQYGQKECKDNHLAPLLYQ
jgi:hypothetical protein